MLWSEGQVWTSPERHGATSAVMKTLIDSIPLPGGAIRRIRGRTLAVMQVSGGSQSSQIGCFALDVREAISTRLALPEGYVEVFSGQASDRQRVQVFKDWGSGLS